MFYLRKTTVLLIGLLLLTAMSACDRDPELSAPATPDPYPFPSTPDQLLQNYARAYATRDLEAYTGMLAEEFLFSFQACDVEKLGLSQDHYDRQDEIETAANMFSGKDLVKTDGQVVPGIVSIEFLVFEREDAWTAAGDAAATAGTVRASYWMAVQFGRKDGSRLSVKGRSVYFAAPAPAADATGVVRDGWRLVGWVDLTEGCGM